MLPPINTPGRFSQLVLLKAVLQTLAALGLCSLRKGRECPLVEQGTCECLFTGIFTEGGDENALLWQEEGLRRKRSCGSADPLFVLARILRGEIKHFSY